MDISYLHEAFELREDGRLFWRKRPREHFKDARAWATWNAQYPGKEAGCRKANHGYIAVRINYRLMLAHRIAWAMTTGQWPAKEIDHRFGTRTDNRFSHLREATKSEQGQNVKLKKTNTSGFTGVSWSKQRKKWRADICLEQRSRHLGLYDTPEAAYAAYLAAKQKLHAFQPSPRKENERENRDLIRT